MKHVSILFRITFFAVLVTTLLILCGVISSAATIEVSGNCGDDATWTLDSDGTLTVSGTGYAGSGIPWQDYRSDIKNVVIEDGITVIYGFEGCENITTVTLGNTMEKIWEDCFRDCTSLKTINSPNSLNYIGEYSFYNCTSLESIYIPEHVTTIGQFAFYGSGLVTVECDAKLNIWGEKSFGNCKNLVSFKHNIWCEYEYIGPSIFENCISLKKVDLHDDFPMITERMFYNCRALEKMYINQNVGEYAFAECTSLSDIDFQRVTRIGKCAFLNCTSITELKFSYFGYIFEEQAFKNCTSLKKIYIYDLSLNHDQPLAKNAFEGCTSLEKIYVYGDSWTLRHDINNVLHSKDKTKIYLYPSGSSLKAYTVANTVNTIEAGAFMEAQNLMILNIPNTVTMIGEDAFADCENLTVYCNNGSYAHKYCVENNVPYSLTNIVVQGDHGSNIKWALYSDGTLEFTGKGVFDTTITMPWLEYVDIINHVVIGDGITEISKGILYDCENLLSLTVPPSVKKVYSLFRYPGSYVNSDLKIYIEDLEAWCNIEHQALMYIEPIYLYLNGKELKHLVIPDTITEVKPWTFSMVYSLQSVIISDSVTKIGEFAFAQTGFSKCIIGDSVEIIDEYAFGDRLSASTEFHFGKSLREIGEEAFYWGGIESITGGENLEVLAPSAFEDSGLKGDIYFPNLKTIGHLAFYNNDILNITLGESVEFIGSEAFAENCELETVTFFCKDAVIYNDITDYWFEGVVRCYKDSSAEAYAMENGIPIEYIYPISVNEMTVTLYNLNDVKDIYFACGEYTTYREIKDNLEFGITSAKLGGASKYSYVASKTGRYSVIVRYNDGTNAIMYADITATEPVFTENGMQLTIGNLEGIKVIRTAYGDYNTAAEIKRAQGSRAFTSKDVLAGVSEYSIQYREEGLVSVAVCYENGHTVIYKYNVIKKTPEMTKEGNTVTFTGLDGLKVLRYAEGEYATSSEIKKAEGSVAINGRTLNSNLVSVTLDPGTYTFCVQYNDESYNYYVVVIE